MSWVGDRPPNFFGRMTKFADDDELPVFGFAFSDLHAGGGSRRVFVASGHFVSVNSLLTARDGAMSARSRGVLTTLQAA
jgi:hypothetical protein